MWSCLLSPVSYLALEELFEKKGDRIASFMVEPIQGEAGVIVPDDDYFPQIGRASCRERV